MSVLLRVRNCALGLRLSDVVLDFPGHRGEGRLDVLALLGRSLQKAHTIVVSHLKALIERNHALVLKIGLVTDQDAGDVVLSVLLDLTHPGVDGAEGVAVCDVISHNDAVRALVVARRDSLEALLASSIPDLQLADFLVDINGTNLKVDANCGHKVLLELIVLKEKIEHGQPHLVN